MLGTNILGRIFQHKFNIKQWFSSKLTFRTWLISVISFLVFGVIFWQFGNIKGIFYQASGADPVAYWKLDEGQGTTVYTSTGTENGTLGAGASGPSWVKEDQCISGNCLFFDGTNDFVNMGDALTSSDSTLGSMSFWFKSTKTDAVQPQIMLYVHNAGDTVEDGFGGGREMHVNLTTSKQVQFYIESWLSGTDLNIISPLTYDDSSWHHVTAVWDKNGSGLGYLYVDGNEVGTGSMATMTSYTLTGNVYVARPLVTDYRMFGGYIDEVKVYDYALSSDQVKAQFASRGSVNGVSAQLGDDDKNRKLSNGLIGYWKMDEGVGTTTSDLSGNNLLGTFGPGTSAPTWTAGKFGNALDFDGSSDYVETNSSTSVVTGAFTMAGWVYFDQEKDYQGVFGKFTDCAGSPTIAYDFCIGSGTGGGMWAQVTNSDGSITASATITESYAGEWMHLTMVWDGVSTLKFYKNGILRDTDVAALTLSTDHPVRMGTKTGNGRDIDGKIDEVRLYNRVLEASEIEDLYNFAPGPVGYWDLNEKTGTTVYDRSSYGNNGSFAAGDSAPIWNKGKFGSGIQFDGSNDGVSIADPTSGVLDFGLNNFTYSFWMKTAIAPSSFYQIVYKRDTAGGNPGYSIALNSSGQLFSAFDDGVVAEVNSTGQKNVVDNAWHHVAVTHERGADMSLYVDGLLEDTDSIAGATGSVSNGNSLFFGRNGVSAIQFYNGTIDDVKIYNYARTQAQIIQDMNGGHPAPGSPVGSALLHYRLDEGYGSIANNVGNAGSTLNGTFSSGTAAPTWTNEGKLGKAISVDGSNDYAYVLDNSLLDISDAITVSVWIKKNAGGGYGHPVRKGNAYFLTSPSDETIEFGIYTGNGSPVYTARSSSSFGEGTWTHMVGTYDGSNVKIYGNGQLAETTAATGNIYNVSSSLTIGQGSGNYFNGSIDEIKIYNFALTADQVKAEFNQGKALVLGAGSTGLGGTSPSNSGSREYCVPGDSSTCSAPVGEWLLNQGVGETFYDTSGNGLNGSFGDGTSAPNWSNGRYEKGLKFDGSGDYTYIPDNSNLDASTTFSVSVWVKTFATSGRILSKHNENITNGWSMGIGASGNAYWDVTGPSHQVVTGVTSINDGNWHLIAATLNGTDQRIYIDGKLDSSRTYSGTPVTNNLSLDFGHILANSTATDFFVGSIDSVRIYQYVRTPAQIAWEYNQGKPLAWYRLDECTGSTAYNAVKNANGQAMGNNGTITIGASGTQTSTGTCSSGTGTQAWNNGTTGKFNSSLNFDGTDDYVNIADNALLDITNGFSTSAWVKFTSLSGFQSIIGKRDVSGIETNYSLRKNSGDELDFFWTSGGQYQIYTTSNTNLVAGSWYHIVATHNGSTPKIYVNGKLAEATCTNQTCNNAMAADDNSLTIGREGDISGSYFNGQIDEVKIFNYELTPAQVKTDMAQAAVRFQ